MAQERIERRLAAIIVADVVGYSRMMGLDEAGTLARMKSLRAELLHPKVAEHGGRIVKTTGDGTLIEFASAVDAVSNAVDVQRGMAERNATLPDHERIHLRLGINVGDIIIDGDDIHGDGVNVAARLEALSDPGGICLSARVHDYVRGRVDIEFDDLGEHSVKNIAEPLHVFRIRLDASAPASPADASATPADTDKPSIAVLPFDNLSGDADQEYFADGLTEDIITALSYWRTLSVIARNSTFAYKGTSPDIREVARNLGVRYVLEGSVRKAGERVRITAQLIDGETGNHVWASKYDRKLEDFFDLQDEITQVIAARVEPELARAEQKRAARKPPASMDVWELYQRGVAALDEMTEEGYIRAREIFGRAAELGPDNSRAHSGIAYSVLRMVYEGHSAAPKEDLAEAIALAKRAVALDDADAVAHFTLAVGQVFSGQPGPAIASARRAVDLNPSHSHAHITLGNALRASGRPEEGIPHIIKGLELNPDDPRAHMYLSHVSTGHLCNRDYEAALDWATKSVERNSEFLPSRLLLVSIHGHLGRTVEASSAIDECNRIQPGIIDDRSYLQLFRDAGDRRDHVFEGLRKAGLPE